MKPVIALPKMENTLFRRYMKHKYVVSLHRAGAKVRWIPLEDLDAAKQLVLACDGLLLPGGGDIDPTRYGQSPSEKCGPTDSLRDRGEFYLLDAFLPTGKPILCICRGQQLLNVYFGGTLHQDITDIQACRHSHFPTRAIGTHDVRIDRSTKLGVILDVDTVRVNSLHHQAADRVGDGLTVCAVSEDGFVEALEKQNHPFCMGVQWHPEHMQLFRRQQKLFQAFVSACRSMT